MDSLCNAAARALAMGDPVRALGQIALRDDAPALALRGIAMAQLGDLGRATDLLRRAARAFGPREALSRARCQVASADVAVSARELGGRDVERALERARSTLEAHGDRDNAIYARLVAARRLLVLGRIDAAARELSALELDGAPARLVAVSELASAEVALRALRIGAARALLTRAHEAALRARIPALVAEIELSLASSRAPAARLIQSGTVRTLRLEEVEAVLASNRIVVDACRRAIRVPGATLSLARRPVLFSLARALGEAWPGEVTREALIHSTFAVRRSNESHRARLRVEIGRLRRLLASHAEISATQAGFTLSPRNERAAVVLAPPLDDDSGALLALLSDGAAWSTSALALALGQSQRTVQRALSALEAAERARSLGSGRSRRWLALPATGFTTALLLPLAPALG